MSDATGGPALGCWIGLKVCGCAVAVVRDDGKPEHAEHREEAKRGFLADGLQVMYATEKEWREKWLPVFLEDCPHGETANVMLTERERGQ